MSQNTTVRINAELHSKIKNIAKINKINIVDYINQSLQNSIEIDSQKEIYKDSNLEEILKVQIKKHDTHIASMVYDIALKDSLIVVMLLELVRKTVFKDMSSDDFMTKIFPNLQEQAKIYFDQSKKDRELQRRNA